MNRLALLAVLSVSSVASADVTSLYQPAAGGVDAFFLNGDAQPATVTSPPTIDATLDGQPVTLRRDASTDSAPLAAGGFRKVHYSLDVSTLHGTHALRIGTTQLALDLGGDATPPTASEPSFAATQPANDSADATDIRTSVGLTEYFTKRISPHEPTYFIAGKRPTAKFQFSLKYQLFNPEGSVAEKFPAVAGFYFAYTQRSFWDLAADSAPFVDSSYMPELLWQHEDDHPGKFGVLSRIDFQAGLKHESNGKDKGDSRSLNIVYARPIFTFGDRNNLFVTVAPRILAYVGNTDDNPDIEEYRGYGDARVIIGQGGGLQLSTDMRFGKDWDKPTFEFDLSYPLRGRSKGNVDLYLYAQYFNGWGEILRDYNERGDSFRIGFALVR